MSNTKIENRIECHALDYESSFKKVVPIVMEHGFRSIVTLQGRVPDLVLELEKSGISQEDRPKIVGVIDYPFGSESIDSRAYQIHSLKEHGADAIEVVAPYRLLNEGKINEAIADLNNLCIQATKCKIELRYVLDTNCEFITKQAKETMCRALANKAVSYISSSLGYYDNDCSLTDIVMWLRDIKKISSKMVKTYINTDLTDDMSIIFKAGAAIIGLDWDIAPYLLHDYKDMVESFI